MNDRDDTDEWFGMHLVDECDECCGCADDASAYNDREMELLAGFPPDPEDPMSLLEPPAEYLRTVALKSATDRQSAESRAKELMRPNESIWRTFEAGRCWVVQLVRARGVGEGYK